MTFDELDEQQTKAALYVLELADIEPTRENARLYLAWDVLSFTEDAQDATAGIWTTKATKHASR